jgi:hypothetical protein
MVQGDAPSRLYCSGFWEDSPAGNIAPKAKLKSMLASHESRYPANPGEARAERRLPRIVRSCGTASRRPSADAFKNRVFDIEITIFFSMLQWSGECPLD